MIERDALDDATEAQALALDFNGPLPAVTLAAEAKQLGWKIKVADKMRRVRGRVFGLVGLGAIGTATARRAKAFGFRIVFHDPHPPPGARKALVSDRAARRDEPV